MVMRPLIVRIMRLVQLQRMKGLSSSLKDIGQNNKKTMPNKSKHEKVSLKSTFTALLKNGCCIEVRHVSQQGVDNRTT